MRSALLCACLAACAVFGERSVRAEEVGVIERVRGARDVMVRPAALDAPRPVTVYFHGMCGGPEGGCRQFREGVSARSWLLCPNAPSACDGGGSSWTSAAPLSTIRRAIDAADRAAPGRVDRDHPGVLIGFSQGTYTVERVLRATPGRWRGAAFVAGFIHLDRRTLERMGVRRVVLAAARNDLTRRTLEETARRLESQGFPVRFVDLGSVGHTYVPSRRVEGWRDALSWLEESY